MGYNCHDIYYIFIRVEMLIIIQFYTIIKLAQASQRFSVGRTMFSSVIPWTRFQYYYKGYRGSHVRTEFNIDINTSRERQCVRWNKIQSHSIDDKQWVHVVQQSELIKSACSLIDVINGRTGREPKWIIEHFIFSISK